MITVNPLLNCLPLRSRGGKLLKKPLARLPDSSKPNRPFPSSPFPLFQNEGRCSAFEVEIIFHSQANKIHFHKKGCAPASFWNGALLEFASGLLRYDRLYLLNTIVTPLVDWSGKVYSRVGSSDLFLIFWCIPSNFHELELFPLCHVGLYNTTPCLPLPSSLSSLPKKINGDESK